MDGPWMVHGWHSNSGIHGYLDRGGGRQGGHPWMVHPMVRLSSQGGHSWMVHG